MRVLLLAVILSLATLLFSQNSTPYFQQEVNYTIHVKLDDKQHQLDASLSIEYINNSPDKIDSIYFHLWPNAYKNYNTALGKQKLEEQSTHFYYASNQLRGYIDSLNFKVNNVSAKWNLLKENEDICILHLNQPLNPSKSISISTPFHVKIPSASLSRLGHIKQSYQITQWYPKPAVYDRDGWHQMPYLNQGEFYSEFGSFDVFITLPKNYVVGATGDLVNGEVELNWLNEKFERTRELTQFNKSDMSFPVSSKENKTLHYHQENVHDFGWFADKRYHVLKGEVELPHSKRKVTTWAMFTNSEANLWKNSIEYLNDATYYYSLWNGDYPYQQVTAVDGTISAGAGMEYPNVTVIGHSGAPFELEKVIMHEVGHNWFYGVLGSNERDHAWMDEGINTMNENRYVETKYPNQKLLGDSQSVPSIANWFDMADYNHKTAYELFYLFNARRGSDQAIEELSSEYTPSNYGGIVYSKTGLAFDYLMAYLGEDLYDKCMKRYFNEWKFKHPQPEDLKHVFETETGKDLNWFFNDIIKTTNKIDYKIIKAKLNASNPEETLIKIKNKGRLNSPFSISGIKDGKIVTTQWYEPLSKKEFVSFKKGTYDTYKIDAQLDIPEISRSNNTLKVDGFLKKIEPLRLQLLSSFDNPDKTQLFFAPIAGWNNNDNLMLGLAFHNLKIPFPRRLEYIIAPLYAFGSKNLTGYIASYYHFTPDKIFQDISVGGYASSFSYLTFNKINSSDQQALSYFKIAPKISFQFKKKRARQFTSLYLDYEVINIFEEEALFSRDPNERGQFRISTNDFYVNNLSLKLISKHPINPFSAVTNLQQHHDFLKLNLTANYHFSYKKKETGFDIRFFIGSFLINNNINSNNRFNFNLSGGEASDYLYNEVFLGRNSTSGIFNQQFAVTDGGFKNLAIAETDNRFLSANRWLSAVNLKSNFFSRFVSIYGDFGLVGSKITAGNNSINKTSDLAYNIGASFNIIPTIFEIYFPFFMSSNLNEFNYNEKIRFTLNLNLLSPIKLMRNIDL